MKERMNDSNTEPCMYEYAKAHEADTQVRLPDGWFTFSSVLLVGDPAKFEFRRRKQEQLDTKQRQIVGYVRENTDLQSKCQRLAEENAKLLTALDALNAELADAQKKLWQLDKAKADAEYFKKQCNEFQQKLEFERAQRAAVEKSLHAVDQMFSNTVSANLDLVQKLEATELELEKQRDEFRQQNAKLLTVVFYK